MPMSLKQLDSCKILPLLPKATNEKQNKIKVVEASVVYFIFIFYSSLYDLPSCIAQRGFLLCPQC